MRLDEFAQLAKTAEWTAEDHTGFHMDVDAALSSESDCFRWDFEPQDTIETLTFDIEWIGAGSALSDIDRDFFRVCGRFAEMLQFISRRVEPDHVVYDVTAGTETHGHVAKFRVVGPRAAQVTRNYAKLRAQRSAGA